MIAYYCGVLPGTTRGHYCDPRSGPQSPWHSPGWPLVDWHPDRDGVSPPSAGNAGLIYPEEGRFVHLTVDGWTLIACWDRSGDSRPGSSATFAFDTLLTPDEALAEARQRWPAVLERIEAHIGHQVTVRGLR